VLFQIASSLLSIRIRNQHTRYYKSVWNLRRSFRRRESFVRAEKRAYRRATLGCFPHFSILPPVDAFTSAASPTRLLATVLSENGMLKGRPSFRIPMFRTGQEKDSSSASNLSRMGYAGRVSFLPEDFNYYADAYKIFGFIDADYPSTEVRSRSVFLDFAEPIDISGSELLSRLYIGRGDSETVDIASPATGLTYHCSRKSGRLYDPY
jgi:hypothetical protein